MSEYFSRKNQKIEVFSNEKIRKILQLRNLFLKLSKNDRDRLKNRLDEPKDIPLSIFNKELGTLESVIKFLREEKNLPYKSIAKLIDRDHGSVGVTYRQSKKKKASRLEISSSIRIPVEIFTNKKFSILENLVSFLRLELGMKFSDI